MREPTVNDSEGGTPIIIANNEKNAPKTSFRRRLSTLRPIKSSDKPVQRRNRPKYPRSASTRATRAMTPISMAITFIDIFIPSEAPWEIASIIFACSFFTSSFTFPLVSDSSVSGNTIFEMTSAPGSSHKTGGKKIGCRNTH